jgi:cobalt-zinc-cadmium efflux system membrane fusion protein
MTFFNAGPSFFARPLALGVLLAFASTVAACGGDDAEPAEGGPATAEGTPPVDDHEGEDVVVLDTAAIRLGGIEVGEVESITTNALAVTGSITFDADRVSHVGSRSNGRILTVRADLGARVTRGQELAILESVEVGQIRAEEQEAEALLKIAKENYAREQRLADQGISSRKELLLAEADLRRAEAALHSAEDRLNVLGAAHDHTAEGRFSLVAPFAGVVVARDASLGEMATPSDTLFTVADLSEVWIALDIFERDFARVQQGQSVAVMATAYPGRTFPGRIVYIGDVLDAAKRTVRARVEVPNRDGALKPGMFATANIQVGGGGTPLAVVSQDALQVVDGKRVVFVPGDAPGEFRPVPVEVGETIDGNRVVILSGIAPGARIVTAGAFALRSELSKGEIGEHGH